MATIRKRGNSWQAQVARAGVRISATFETKAKASAWATEQEADLQTGKRRGIPPGKTFGDLLERYRDEVSINKRGEKWEPSGPGSFLVRDPRQEGRPLPAPAGGRRHDADRQDAVPDDGRLRRIRANDDQGTGHGGVGASQGTRQATWAAEGVSSYRS